MSRNNTKIKKSSGARMNRVASTKECRKKTNAFSFFMVEPLESRRMLDGLQTFSALDAGAGPTAPRPNSDTAAASFDAAAAAIAPESIITFEGVPTGSVDSTSNLSVAPGVTINGVNKGGNPQAVLNSPSDPGAPRLSGYNTTEGGSEYVNLIGGTVTFTFATPIQYFGAYFPGSQDFFGNEIDFTDADGAEEVDIPGGSSSAGGVAFAGFVDPGASITSVTINGGDEDDWDAFGVDDVRYEGGGEPDLTADFASSNLASHYNPGQTIPLSLQISTNDADASGDETNQYYLSTSDNPDDEDDFVTPALATTTTTLDLSPDESDDDTGDTSTTATDSPVLTIPQGTEPGEYYVIAEINTGETITESDYSNNTAVSDPIEIDNIQSASDKQALPQQIPGTTGLIFITHGWNSDSTSWVTDMANQIEIQLTAKDDADDTSDAANWDIWTYDWSDKSALWKFPVLLNNATEVGTQVGDGLANGLYSFSEIHFIAHSAGCNLIDTATNIVASDGHSPQIAETFLDPYHGAISNQSNWPYGQHAAFSDEYYNDNDLSGTNDPSSAAFNVDVTALDTIPTIELVSRHSYPHVWYSGSIDDVAEEEYGFAISPEYSGDSPAELRLEYPSNSVSPVKLDAVNNGTFENETFVPWVPSDTDDVSVVNAPAPGVASAVELSGASSSITQNIDTPANDFNVSFSDELLGTGGELQVLLNSQVIANVGPLTASDTQFQQQQILVSSSALQGLESVPLTFQFSGPAGDPALLTNVGVSMEDFQVMLGIGVANSVIFTGTDGTKTTVSLSKGTGTLDFQGVGLTTTASRRGTLVSGTGISLESIELSNTTDASQLVISDTKTLRTSSGQVEIGSITDPDAIGAISATSVNLSGDVEVDGSVRSLALKSVVAGQPHLITLGGAAAGPPVAVKLGSVTDLQLVVGAAGAISVGSWNETTPPDNSIAASSIRSIRTSGNFDASIFLSGGPAASLQSATIGGSVTAATWDVTGGIGSVNIRGTLGQSAIAATGSIGSVLTGGMSSSFVSAGLASDLTSIPTSSANFASESASIRLVAVRGVFSGSTIAAWTIFNAQIATLSTNDGGSQFGLAAHRIDAASSKAPKWHLRKATVGPIADSAPLGGDFLVRLL